MTTADGARYRVTSLDDIESVPGPGTLTAERRRPAGVHAVGVAALERAIDLEPSGELVAHARSDEDLAALRDDPRFVRLTAV